ncbi:Ankyrin repeat-containing protein [Spironucleus salmonicida]|uniref:Ankyrin repeat-containing protein n=1 Tax=Spironucleus salmonicida TaxID=348837 RepID=V6LUK5_9EUKA|nr:Ankyrin repeat-containing protein [Spironucleus salmonicida]|eukprot:EST47386.1 Transmembrane domain-containing protein [Spironucleus salmonicida]
MCFSMCAQPKTEWFQAAATNNVMVLKQLSQFNSFDQGDNDLESTPQTITGFAGIHYAAFTGSVLALNILLEFEIEAKTQVQSIVAINKLRFILAAGTTPLMAAVAGGQEASFQLLKTLKMKRNNDGVSALIIAVLLDREFAIKELFNEINLFDREGNSAISYACLFGRLEILKQLQELCLQQHETKIFFLRALLTKNIDGKLPVDMAMQAVDESRYSISAGQKQKCMLTVSSLMTGLQQAVDIGDVKDMGIQQKLQDLKEVYKNSEIEVELFIEDCQEVDVKEENMIVN